MKYDLPPRTLRDARRLLRPVAMLTILLGLVACTSAPLGSAGDLLVRLTQQTAEPSQFTASRADLAAAGVTGPLLKVVRRTPEPASAGYPAVGAANGTVFYRGNDGSEVQLSAGLLMATVAFGTDLHGADVAPVARALLAGGGTYTRALRHMGAGGHLVKTTFSCTLTPRATETITILGRAHATTRFEESCQATPDVVGRVAAFTNRYWLGADGVRAGEHWVSPDVGMLRIEQVLP